MEQGHRNAVRKSGIERKRNIALPASPFLELDLISDLVADYEGEHFPVKAPSLVEVIKLRIVHRLIR